MEVSLNFKNDILLALLAEAEEALSNAIPRLVMGMVNDEFISGSEQQIIAVEVEDISSITRRMREELAEIQNDEYMDTVDELVGESVQHYEAQSKRQDRIDELVREADDLHVTVGQKDRYIDELLAKQAADAIIVSPSDLNEERTPYTFDYDSDEGIPISEIVAVESAEHITTLSTEDANMSAAIDILSDVTSVSLWPKTAQVAKFEGVQFSRWGKKDLETGIVIDCSIEDNALFADADLECLYKVAFMEEDRLNFAWIWAGDVEATGRQQLEQCDQDILESIGFYLDSQSTDFPTTFNVALATQGP